MHSRSQSAEAIILNARCLKNDTGGGENTRSDAAAAWVELAIAARCDPTMRQGALSSGEYAGEWLLTTVKEGANHPGYPGKPAEELFDQIFIILARLGRLRHEAGLQPWHGNVLPDDSSACAVGLRVKLAREALAIDQVGFYRACNINLKAGQALEAGHCAFASFDNGMLLDICARHDIPEGWIMFGTAEDLEP